MSSQRITSQAGVCGGKPCIRGLRFPVSRILGLLAAGESPDSLLASYPFLESDDLREALRFGSRIADDPSLSLVDRDSE